MRFFFVLVAAVTLATGASAGRVLGDIDNGDLLDGVSVTIAPGGQPRTSAQWIARRVVGASPVADARLVSLHFCTDFLQNCIAGTDALPGGRAIWIARFEGRIRCCSFGPPGLQPLYVPRAYFALTDSPPSVIAFGTG
jgi:hypothetical protein